MKRLIILILAFFIQTEVFSQKPEIYTTNGKAIDGYDPVAYFTMSKPVKGKSELKSSYKGADWFFSTAENKKLFEANPEKYTPQYGGYCAFGVAGGYKAKISPEAWTIVNDKLFLNYNLDVQKDWLENRDQFIQKANANWSEVKKQ